MPIPSMADVGRLLGPLAGFAGRVAGQAAWGGVKLGARAAVPLGIAGAQLGVATAVGLGGAAVMTAKAAYNVATRTAAWSGRSLGAGRGPFVTQPLRAFGRTYNIPHQFNRATQNAIVFGAAGLAGTAGLVGAIRGPRWNVNEAIGTGAIEVERPDFLGATGSLALATAATGRRRRMMEQMTGGGRGFALPPQAMMFADDVAMMAMHGFARRP